MDIITPIFIVQFTRSVAAPTPKAEHLGKLNLKAVALGVVWKLVTRTLAALASHTLLMILRPKVLVISRLLLEPSRKLATTTSLLVF